MGYSLGELEQLILLALLRMNDDGYGAGVQREIEERAGRRVALGAVYASLMRLEGKGFVASREGEPTAQRGGRRRRLYRVTPLGHRALTSALGALRALARGIAPRLETP
ncbi:MAG: PadR family transcriptional regulator [Gemmatimonadaceae bacterium]